MEKVFELSNVSLSLKATDQRVDVLTDFNLDVKAGEYLMITGRSGSGKSSILNLMSGLVAPTAGSVLFRGEPLAKKSQADMCTFRNKNIGYIFQSFNLIEQFNVFENISVPLLIAGVAKSKVAAKVDELLEKLELANRKSHYPHELSGGEQQRVAIGRALVNDPEVILADEPTGNLDKQTAIIIADLIKSVHNSGKTIVLVTHDTNLVSYSTRNINIE